MIPLHSVHSTYAEHFSSGVDAEAIEVVNSAECRSQHRRSKAILPALGTNVF